MSALNMDALPPDQQVVLKALTYWGGEADEVPDTHILGYAYACGVRPADVVPALVVLSKRGLVRQGGAGLFAPQEDHTLPGGQHLQVIECEGEAEDYLRPDRIDPSHPTVLCIPHHETPSDEMNRAWKSGEKTRWIEVRVDGKCIGRRWTIPLTFSLTGEGMPLLDARPGPVKAREGDSPEDNVFRKDGDVWRVGFQGDPTTLKDSKGVFYIWYLLRRPDQPVSAIELTRAHERNHQKALARRTGNVSDGEAFEHGLSKTKDLGDAGGALDAEAEAAYRDRLQEIENELDRAGKDDDEAVTRRLVEEKGSVERELARGLGLKGKARREKSHPERARKAVLSAITSAMKKIEGNHEGLWRHLQANLTTGTECVYRSADPPLTWNV